MFILCMDAFIELEAKNEEESYEERERERNRKERVKSWRGLI